LRNGDEELFLVLNDRPNANKVIRLLLRSKKVHRVDTLPDFTVDQLNSHRCTKLTDYSEFLSDDSVSYNPFLVYVNTDSGFVLDTPATRIENVSEYGGFYGFSPDENLHVAKRH
jgi:hypothetical protein